MSIDTSEGRMHVSRTEHQVIASTYWRLVFVREGEPPVELGTVPTEEDFEEWFTGAFASGVLPDPRYTDEIQCLEVVGEHQVMKYVWRVSWHQFESKRIM